LDILRRAFRQTDARIPGSVRDIDESFTPEK